MFELPEKNNLKQIKVYNQLNTDLVKVVSLVKMFTFYLNKVKFKAWVTFKILLTLWEQ